MKKVIYSDKAPETIGPYSRAIKTNGMVSVSGQLPIDAATGLMPDGVKAQARQLLENTRHTFEAAGLTVSGIVKTTVFLQDMSLFVGINGVYATYFEDAFSTRSAATVKASSKDASAGIECITAR